MAILEDVTPQNVAVVVQEAIDTERNNSRFLWFQGINGINELFLVYFVLGADGVWRLESM